MHEMASMQLPFVKSNCELHSCKFNAICFLYASWLKFTKTNDLSAMHEPLYLLHICIFLLFSNSMTINETKFPIVQKKF